MLRGRVSKFFGQEEEPIKQYIWNVQEVRHYHETGNVVIFGQEEEGVGLTRELRFGNIKSVDILGVNTARISSVEGYTFVARIRARSAGEEKKYGAVVARFKESESGYRSVLVFYEKAHKELM